MVGMGRSVATFSPPAVSPVAFAAPPLSCPLASAAPSLRAAAEGAFVCRGRPPLAAHLGCPRSSNAPAVPSMAVQTGRKSDDSTDAPGEGRTAVSTSAAIVATEDGGVTPNKGWRRRRRRPAPPLAGLGQPSPGLSRRQRKLERAELTATLESRYHQLNDDKLRAAAAGVGEEEPAAGAPTAAAASGVAGTPSVGDDTKSVPCKAAAAADVLTFAQAESAQRAAAGEPPPPLGAKMRRGGALSTRRRKTSSSAGRSGRGAGSVVELAKDDASVAVLSALRDLGLTVEDVQRAVRRRPALLRCDVARDIAPVVAFLRSPPLSLRNRRQLAKVVLHGPSIFCHPRPVETFTPRLAFLRDVAMVPATQLAAVVVRRPHLLWANLSTMGAVVTYLRGSLPELKPADLGALLARVPQALLLAPPALAKNLRWLRDTCGLENSKDLSTVVSALPLVLLLNTERTLSPRVALLKKEYKVPTPVLAKVLVATPHLLEASVDGDLRAQVGRLQAYGEFSSDDLSRVISTVPAFFGLDFTDRLTWLREQVGLDATELTHVIRTLPAVLMYAVDGNLDRKWSFLTSMMGATKADVVAHPRLLSYHLEQRAMPRHAFLASRGMTGVAVGTVLGCTDKAFCRDVARCELEEYRAYERDGHWLLFYNPIL
ncbi:hypothetical protein MMPV_006943 [Pyropia vietnamensis]